MGGRRCGLLASCVIVNAIHRVYVEMAKAVSLSRLIDNTQRDILAFLQNSGLDSPDRHGELGLLG